jgi:hypothetical protein
MLNPDIEKTKTSLLAGTTAASAATNYAQAAITAVPDLDDPPAWFAPIQKDLDTAQSHAQHWLDAICPAVSVDVPRGIIDFNATFQARTSQILDLMKEIEGGTGQPTAQQCGSIRALFGDLGAAIAAQEASVIRLQTEVRDYSADIKRDQDVLARDLGAVQQRFVDGRIWAQKMTAVLGETFLDSKSLGPCNAIPQINFNISVRVAEVASDPSLVTMVYAKAILEHQINNSRSAQLAVEAVLGGWTTLRVKNEAVIDDLNKAQPSQYVATINELNLRVAQTQWQQLSDFTANLMNGT